MEANKIFHGDVLDVLPKLSENSVNCIITSPPYFGLRDYRLPRTDWPEISYAPMAGLPEITVPAMTCCLGLEGSIEAYVGHMVLVWRELWRVLRGDGVGWLNLGDSYSSNASRQNGTGKTSMASPDRGSNGLGRFNKTSDLKPKNLIGIPWRVAFALQADGWYLRSDVIWAKKNPMPESVTDRPTKAHEYLFLLAKSDRYWYDQDAIREPHSNLKREMNRPTRRDNQKKSVNDNYSTYHTAEHQPSMDSPMAGHPNGRNKRTIWSIATKPYKDAHFAVMPEALIEPCLLATCPAQVCAECDEPWARVVEKTGETYKTGGGNTKSSSIGPMDRNGKGQWDAGAISNNRASISLGFAPTCQCSASTKPCIVLDPFFGAGTVGVVAKKLKRDWLGIELNEDYIKMANTRLDQTQPALFAR